MSRDPSLLEHQTVRSAIRHRRASRNRFSALLVVGLAGSCALLPLGASSSASANMHSVPVDDVRMTTTPQPHLAVQNTYFTSANVSSYGIINDVIPISGTWFLTEGTFGYDFADFVSATQQDVQDRLETYKTNFPEVSATTTNTLVMDLENPGLKDLHQYSDNDQDAIIAAYKVRIAATRAEFPNAKIAVYGTLNPDPQGRATQSVYVARLDALIRAGDEGLFDDLDFLIPVLYVHYGCDDAGDPAKCDASWGTLVDYTQLGIDGSSQLKRSDGTSIPLMPFLSFRVVNGASPYQGVPLISLGVPNPVPTTLGEQIYRFSQAGVTDYVFYTGTNNNELGDPSGPPLITDFFDILFP